MHYLEMAVSLPQDSPSRLHPQPARGWEGHAGFLASYTGLALTVLKTEPYQELPEIDFQWICILCSVVSKGDGAKADGAGALPLCPRAGGWLPPRLGPWGSVNAIGLFLLALAAQIQA